MNDYERGFIDGMSRQAQSSVDRAVNAMTREWQGLKGEEHMTDRELFKQALDAMLTFPEDISDEMFEVIRALKERLAQDWDEVEALRASLREHMAEIHRLRQWQGLTDEELDAMRQKSMLDFVTLREFRAAARAVEAKLKERNT